MQQYQLQIGSATNAMKAKRALSKEGIAVVLGKQASDRQGGCRYSLQVSAADLLHATLVLREQGIPYRVEA